jgi:hypothetical protein
MNKRLIHAIEGVGAGYEASRWVYCAYSSAYAAEYRAEELNQLSKLHSENLRDHVMHEPQDLDSPEWEQWLARHDEIKQLACEALEDQGWELDTEYGVFTTELFE